MSYKLQRPLLAGVVKVRWKASEMHAKIEALPCLATLAPSPFRLGPLIMYVIFHVFNLSLFKQHRLKITLCIVTCLHTIFYCLFVFWCTCKVISDIPGKKTKHTHKNKNAYLSNGGRLLSIIVINHHPH